MSGMYDPAHPGEIIREAIMAEGWTVAEAAARLRVTRNALSRVLNGKAGVSPEMPGTAHGDARSTRPGMTRTY